jgi:hypothetical protein
MLGNGLAVCATAAHTNEAAIVVAVLATPSVVPRLLGVATVGTVDSSRRARTRGEGRVAAQHGNTRAILGATKGDHVLANVGSDNLATLHIGVRKDVLDEIVAELVASNVHKWHARTIGTGLADDVEVTVEEVRAANLEALLDNLGGELIHAVLCGITQNVVDSTVTVRKSAVLADVLDAPIAELPVGDDIDASKDLVDTRTLVFVETVLEDVLDHQTASLTERDFVPHATQGLVDVLHDLRWRTAPAELEQLLPDMASIAVDDSFRDAAEKLVDHDGLVLLRHAVKRLLNDVASERVHAEVQSVTTNSLCNGHHLLRRAMLEAALDQEVTETVDHEWIGLVDDGLHDVKLLLWRAKFQLLLKEDGSLLVIAANNLVDDVAPVAAHVTIKQAAIVEWLDGAHVGWSLLGHRLLSNRLPLTSEVRSSRREPSTNGRLQRLARCRNLLAVDLGELTLIEILVERRSRRC